MSTVLAAGLALAVLAGIAALIGPHLRDYVRACRTPESGEER